MELNDIHECIEKIGCLTITTMDGGTMHSRIVSVCGGDDEGIYFLTMEVKPFYRQLNANPQLSMCGIYPTSRKDGKNEVGQPYFPPGFTFRLTGEAREVPMEEVAEKADAGSAPHMYTLEEIERYSSMRLFCIHKGKGEIYDFDFEMEHRDHKLLRTRFSFGGETHNEPGASVNAFCIACGKCFDACSFNAIEKGDPYRINGSRCDECGSCADACPQFAILKPKTL